MWRSERGSVTAESAVALPTLLLLMILGLSAVAAAGQQLRCVDAAREGARALARGEPDPMTFARRVAPAGAAVRLTTTGSLVRVEVTVHVRLAGPTPLTVPVHGIAVAATEAEPASPRPGGDT